MRWYLRSCSLRESKSCSPSAAWRRITRRSGVGWDDGPELEQRLRPQLKPTNKSWRVDETYIRVQGRWCYLYRAIDSTGATIDFLLSALRDAAAAKRLFRQALSDHLIRSPASSTLIRPASTARRLPQ